MTFTFDKNYKNLDQVAPFYEAYTAVRAELEAAGKYNYNDSFKGRIVGIEGPNEDTAIYLLQTLHSIREMMAEVDAFVAEGATPIDTLNGPTRFAKVMRYGWYLGGTGLATYEDVRVVPDQINGRPQCILPKGRRTNGYAAYGNLLGVKS
jgi:hypothetical protein